MKTASSLSLTKDPMFHCIGRISWPSQTGATSRSTLTATQRAQNFQKQSLINHTNPLLTQPMNNKKILCLLRCDFDRASSLICGNKMPTRCNRGFYCISYCLLYMFRAPLCPSSGAQEYYTVVAACGISCCGFQVSGLVWS